MTLKAHLRHKLNRYKEAASFVALAFTALGLSSFMIWVFHIVTKLPY
jgi:hypothetical protein